MDPKSRGRAHYQNKVSESQKYKSRGGYQAPRHNPPNRYVEIYKDTVAYCEEAEFEVKPAIKYYFVSEDFTDDVILAGKQLFDQPAQIIVENMDSFDMARSMNNENGTIMVLNLASDVRPGGGVKKGSLAQEEDLFRKSNYYQATDEELYSGRLSLSEVIYSPMVHIIKDSEYKLLREPVVVSCLAVAALRNPKVHVNEDGDSVYNKEVDLEIMKEKIDMIFKVAIYHGHLDLVLGALGCGVFNNPPKQVAMLFKNAISKYGNYFKRIGFAVLSKSTSNMNFQIFNDVLTN
jgi:uncharacterized protein (TIGR02452 family)